MSTDVQRPRYSAAKSWAVALICFAMAVVFIAVRFKVAPTMVDLMTQFNIGTAAGGWLMSVTTFAGIILAIPTGMIMLKFGPIKITVVAIVVTLVSTIVGVFAPSFEVLLATRIFEGLGTSLVSICMPAIIAPWFPKEKLGFPMSIFSTFVGVGMLIILNAAVPLMTTFGGGWRTVWWFSAIILAVVSIAFLVYVRMPKVPFNVDDDEIHEMKDSENAALGSAKDFFEALKNVKAWTVILCMTVFAICSGSILTYAPTFMNLQLGIEIGTANSLSSIMNIAMIAGGFIMGVVLNKGKKHWGIILVISCVLSAIAFTTEYMFTAATALLYMIVAGLIFQMIPACTFTMTPACANRPAVVGVLMALFTFAENIGAAIGPAVTGAMIESTPGTFVWMNATPFLAILGVSAIVLSIAYMVLDKKQKEQKASAADAD
ncbi:MFS transporter [Adlercreutzia sp. ZJ304]|uniref:MFS transporter n=1 Tax=Adlercreutzia sp. ZJ304 TaxID=2709791 RepID=UPI0013EB85BC